VLYARHLRHHAESRFGTPERKQCLRFGHAQRLRFWTFGLGLRAQWDSLEIDAGVYQERPRPRARRRHGRPRALQYEEISYVIFPWLVPAIRVEVSQVQPAGGSSIHDVRITPGIAFLVRPNLKLALIGSSSRQTGRRVPGGGRQAASRRRPRHLDDGNRVDHRKSRLRVLT